ncbi:MULTISPECIES: NAD+ synthase [Filomicrobium]|uniref:Glutamine-dependent NAD(+) synthetase n=1 Tax=Filomicrobium insigne TaxID=418854 RepID=A0A1H0QYI5_9HYPH|nr:MULTISPECIES: NAD+ synthase [Filomicrobium]MCV0369456.1 NAD+ synthase [Filomicrobium sp.]SDP22331.1 NH(3)-dependent NAD(+) synthetase [Filomicrobium insigne]
MKIALAQLNPTVGDIAGNVARVREAREKAAAMEADLVVFPELFISGYPPEDLVLRPSFQTACRSTVEALAKSLGDGPAVLLGTVWPDGDKVYNAAVLIDAGEVVAVRYKVDLPNYGVFDEKRVFEPGPMPGPINFRGVRLGVPICEDIWREDVVECLSECGAEILIVPNGSPFDWNKPDARTNVVLARVVETELPLVYLNQVGGQDELVFDGASFVINADHSLAAQLPGWEESLTLTEWSKTEDGWVCAKGEFATLSERDAAAYQACMLGLRDYVDKNRFPGVVLGMSGGIDSALVAALAVDALGADRVHCVMLPYRYTSKASLEDAKACASALEVRYDIVPVVEPVEAMNASLAPLFAGRTPDITEENIQSRVRGTLLMAISNKLGSMVLTTGNKSEMSVGYATLYGDMNGGFNPIKDLYKTDVYRLARWRNSHTPKSGRGPGGIVIPEHILTKAPSAELRENQTDQDSLPPYDVLDAILQGLVEEELPISEIVAQGFDHDTVTRVENLLYISEYKRRQAAPGVKISSRNFGRDRRYPITNRFREH